ncbi:MAG: hypothetical protein C4527_03235 [Candidatus Omnitrophota bacterium]|jgi:4-amino-4-deoxy-L-arabinose transferase-like glycosyltransferase|nr:MAG: hypothetical protein C4527_03235 [Candidatus Omnitrophota bacterium]
MEASNVSTDHSNKIVLRERYQFFPILLLLIIGCILRFCTIGFGTNVDEGDYLMQGRELARGLWPYLDVHLNKPPLVTILGFPFFLISDIPIIPVRIFMTLLSVSSIFALWILGRELIDDYAGLFAAAFLAFDPYAAIWAKYLHVSTLAPTLALWTLSLLALGLRNNRRRMLILSGFFASLCLLNKQTGIFVLPIAALLIPIFSQRNQLKRVMLYFGVGFFPLLAVFGLWMLLMGALQPFLYNVLYGNMAMSGFFHYTLADRWSEFRAVMFFNPLSWWFVVLGLLSVFFRRWSIGLFIILWLFVEIWANMLALSHVWQHYILALMPPAYLLSGVFLSWALTILQKKIEALRLPISAGIGFVLLCTAPFWPRANWAYPNITMEDERALAAFIRRNCSTDYLLCFVNSAFYIWTDKEIPPSVRDGRQERIPPFMNTAGRKYLTADEMKQTVELWKTLPMDFCLMYEKYYRQIFIDRDPHLEPVRRFLEDEFTQTQDIRTKPTYYAHMICFKKFPHSP